jgi:hypothetical protein
VREGDQGTACPTDQRHRLVRPSGRSPTTATETSATAAHSSRRTRPIMQQPQQPTTPPPQQQRMMLPPPQAFVGAGLAGMPTGGFGAAAAAAVAAARARAAEQMAYEDACKVLNPDFLTSFASVEDAVSRCARARDPSFPLARSFVSSTVWDLQFSTRFRAPRSSRVLAWILRFL